MFSLAFCILIPTHCAASVFGGRFPTPKRSEVAKRHQEKMIQEENKITGREHSGPASRRHRTVE